MFALLLVLVGLSFGLSIEDAMRMAEERNLQIRALKERVGVYEGLERSATAFPNPEVSVESGFLTTDRNGKPSGRALYLLEYAQPIPMWGVREKGRSVVEKEREAFLSELEARRREILAGVYRSFHEALMRREIAQVWRESLKTAREVEEFVRRAYELGEVTELELLRARRESDMAEVQLRIAESLYRASLKELSRLLNTEVEEVEGDLGSMPSLKDTDVESAPTVLALKRRAEAVGKLIELERALAKPSLRAGFVVEDSEEGYYGLRLSLSAEFPVFYRRQGEILRGIALRKALGAELEDELLRLRSRLSSVKIRMSALTEELRRLEEEIIPRTKEELELAIKSYRLRVITLLELSDVRRRYYELLVRRAELFGDLHRTYAEFIEIGGWR